MIEFDVDMNYLIEEGELDRVVLNDENGEYEPMEFQPSGGECEPTEENTCNLCGQDLVACDVGVGANGGAIELDPPILFNFCPNCGKAVKR